MPKFACKLLAAALALSAPLHHAVAQTTIRMWTFLNPAATSPREVALAEIIKRFEAANPDIRVTVEPQVWDQMTPKFLAAARAGNAPDVSYITTDMLGEAFRSGELADLNALFMSKWTEEQRAGRRDVFWNACSVNGKQHCSILSRSYTGILYRRDFFAQAGIDPASIRTWPDFIAAAKRLTQRDAAGNVSRWGFGQAFSEAQADPPMMLPLAIAVEGKLFQPDGHAAFATPGGIAALTREVAMVTDAKVTPPDVVNWTIEDGYDAFAAGRVAMMEGSSLRVSVLKSRIGADKVGLMLWPGEGSAEHAPGMVSGWAVGAWAHGKNVSAAARWLEYLTGIEADIIWVRTGGEMPTTPEGRAAVADYLAQPDMQYPDNRRGGRRKVRLDAADHVCGG